MVTEIESIIDHTGRVWSKEEIAEDTQRYKDEQVAIHKAITVGLSTADYRVSKKRDKKIRSIVDAALDALPWGHGLNPLTPMELEFAETFAHTLADDMEYTK